MKRAAGFIPRSRLEGLTDGVFAFAMTLLGVNIELPEGFDPKTNQEFLSRLADLLDTFVAYIIAFFVLVSFWFSRAQVDGEPETASTAYAWGRAIASPVGHLCTGAAWIFGANMILLAVTALAISRIAERDTGRAQVPSGYVEFGILIASAVLSLATSLFAPDYAMLPYLINVASPLAARAVYQH